MDTKELVERLHETLIFYENHGAGCRLIHSGGDASRNELARDGGTRAKDALAAVAALAETAEAEAAALRGRVERFGKALKYIKRAAGDRPEKAWFRLDMIMDEADAALTEEPKP